MSTYTQIIYQIVFSTKFRDYTLKGAENRLKLYKYIWGVIKNNKCVVYKINGIENHIHIATHIHPSVSLSFLVKDIKVASSIWIKQHQLFPEFVGWGGGYGAFTYNLKQKANLERYIENQVEHHKKRSVEEEYLKLLCQNGINYEKKYLF
jgi:REP element-mobilizing transposase RayT